MSSVFRSTRRFNTGSLQVKLTPLETYLSAFGWSKWLDALITRQVAPLSSLSAAVAYAMHRDLRLVKSQSVRLSAGFSAAPLLLKSVQEAIEAEQRALDEVLQHSIPLPSSWVAV